MSRKLASISDAHVIELYLDSQSPEYFEEIYERYSGRVYSRCMAMLRDSASAQDAVQDIFVKLFTKLSAYDKKSMFSTWVNAITYNYCIDLIRKSKRQLQTIPEEKIKTREFADLSTIEAELNDEQIGKLNKALTGLSDEERALIFMKYYDDMSVKEICESLNKSESAIKMKLMRARNRIEKLISETAMDFVIFVLLIWLIRK